MLNTIEFYKDLGEKEAVARNQRDEARASFNRDHFRRALALEKDDDKALASRAYDEGYKEARNIPRVEYFK